MHVDTEQFLKDLEILVNMDSGRGNPEGCTAVGAYFAKRLAAKGWITQQLDVGDAVGKCTVVKNREADWYDALLVGHVDTVFPAGETAKRPFRRDETRAYGLGTIDMKQGTLAMCYVLEQLPPEVKETLNICAIFNPDEEIGSIYSAPLIDSYAKRSRYAYVFEAASTDGSHTISRKGMASYTIAFHGRAGHAGYLFDGTSRSAINELLYWSNAFNGLLSRERGTSVNIGLIQGGTASNIVSDFAQMSLEVRYARREEYAKLAPLLAALKRHAQESEIEVAFIKQHEIPPMEPGEATFAYVTHLQALCEANGLEFKLKPRGGVSDANHIAACGPICLDGLAPTGDHDHSDREYLELSTIEPNLRLAHLILCDLSEVKKQSTMI